MRQVGLKACPGRRFRLTTRHLVIDALRMALDIRRPDAARVDIVDYIECFYNRKRRHGYLGNVSPADFERAAIGHFNRVLLTGEEPHQR
jgi:transposase InsO family protein